MAAGLYALSVLGIGEMVASLIMGQIVDKLSNKMGCVMNIISIVLVWAASITMIHTETHNFIVYLFTFAWGFMDGAVNTHTTQILGFEFDTACDPFSVFTFV